MRLQDHKGYLFTLSYYILALIVSYIVFLIFGWEYIHAPGFHHLTFLLFLIGGIVWSIINIIQLFRKKGSFYKESLIVHLVLFIGLIIWVIVAFIIVEYPKNEPNNSNSKSISLINSKDTSLLINEMNDTIYLQIKDSIYIDKRNK
jgi:hypothetical protein